MFYIYIYIYINIHRCASGAVGCLWHYYVYPLQSFYSFSLFLREPPLGLSVSRFLAHPCTTFLASFFLILLISFFTESWSNLEPTWPQLGLQNRPKLGPRAIQNSFKILPYFGYPFGQFFCGFWLQLGPQNHPKT